MVGGDKGKGKKEGEDIRMGEGNREIFLGERERFEVLMIEVVLRVDEEGEEQLKRLVVFRERGGEGERGRGGKRVEERKCPSNRMFKS